MPNEKDSSINKSSKKLLRKLDVDQMIAAFEARCGKKPEPEKKEEDEKTQKPETGEDTDNE